ncbi:MAG: protein kinase, partial [Deltaproteobacteria bacterium]|nr:protein kinase [Deltaproteobacteria bacterium]
KTDEARITSPLQHANIVSIYEFDQVDGQYYLAMEHVHGRDLQRVMARANKLGRTIPDDLALYVTGEVCKALWYAYNARDNHGNPLRIIHRDVSPSNILISFDGEVKVTDFGVAKAANSTREASGGLKGKLGYMAPEQVKGGEVDHRSDLFALGIILFESLTLKRLFMGRTDLQTLINVRDADVEKRLARHPEIAAPVAEILRKALARVPDKRFRNATELLNAIQDCLFQRNRRVGPEHVAGLMHDLFAEEAEQEILPLEIEEVTEVGRSLGGSPATALPAPPRTGQTPTPKAPDPSESTPPPADQTPPAPADGRPPAPTPRRQAAPAPPTDESIPLDESAEPPQGTTRATRISPMESSFAIRDATGKVFGPVSFANFLSLVKSRAISEDEMCSMNGGEWIRVGEVAAIRAEISETRAEDARRSVLFEGAVERRLLIRVVCDVTREKRLTGLLQFRQGSRHKQVYFRDGRVRFIRSNLRDELIGEFLRRKGLVSEDQLASALASPDDSQAKRIGDSLLAKGVLKPHELADLLQEQFRRRFLDLFQWDGGWYGFFEGASPPRGCVSSDLDAISTLAEAVRTLYPPDLCRAWLSDYLTRRLVLVEAAKVPVSDLMLVPKELRVVNLIDQHPSVTHLLRTVPQTQEWQAIVYRMVFLLIQCGTYQFRGLAGAYR